MGRSDTSMEGVVKGRVVDSLERGPPSPPPGSRAAEPACCAYLPLAWGAVNPSYRSNVQAQSQTCHPGYHIVKASTPVNKKRSPRFTCGECGYRDVLVLKRGRTASKAQAVKLAVCPQCGERDKQAVISYWLPAGALAALPTIVALVLAFTAVSGSTVLQLICLIGGVVGSLGVVQIHSRPKWKSLNEGISFEKVEREELEYVTGRRKAIRP